MQYVIGKVNLCPDFFKTKKLLRISSKNIDRAFSIDLAGLMYRKKYHVKTVQSSLIKWFGIVKL